MFLSAPRKREIIGADVLVVGGGGAALRAAIEARRSKANVLIVSKSRLGYGSTVIAGGGFRVAIGDASSEEHFNETVVNGRFLSNQRLAKILAQEGPSRVLELRDFGLEVFSDSPGHCLISGSYPGGPRLVRSLCETALKMGVKIKESTMVIDLIRNERVMGALAIDLKTRRVLSIAAKVTILATGGAGQIYVSTDNPSRNTGDGYAIAFRAGAQLLDMEFVQFYPLGLSQRKGPAHYVPPTAILKGVLRNVAGEDFMKKYGVTLKEGLSSSRDLLARAVAIEISEKRGTDGAVFLDLTKVSERLKTLRPGRYKVCLTQHFCMGGIRINEYCETNVQGLYAVGEVTGGIHGANRLGGNALTELMVFGARAGKYAAAFAQESPNERIDGILTNKLRRVEELVSHETNARLSPTRIKEKIKIVMENSVKVVRDKSGLNRALDELQRIKKESLPNMYMTGNADFMEAFEVVNMADVAEMVARSASFRNESRGAHYRIDYLRQDDDNWLRNNVISNRHNSIQLTAEPVEEFHETDRNKRPRPH